MADPSSSPKSTIQASATSVQLGKDFSLPYTVLGELEMAVDFSWEYPGQKVSRGEEEAVCMLWWCLGQGVRARD